MLWYPLDDYSADSFEGASAVAALAAAGLFAIFALRFWMLREVFTLPPRAGGPVDRRVVWLRRLLYLAVADCLILRPADGRVPDALVEARELVLWGSATVLFALALRTGGRLRAWILVSAPLAAAGRAATAVDEVPGVGALAILLFACLAGTVVWQVLVLVGQRRDGRWSRATVTAGWLHLAASAAVFVASAGISAAFTFSAPSLIMIVDAFDVFLVVWLARSAHELPASPNPADRTPSRLPGRSS